MFWYDDRTSIDKVPIKHSPSKFKRVCWRKPNTPRSLNDNQSKCETTSKLIVRLIKLQVRNRCQLQNARFYEVPRRPGMLLMFQHPRRSQYAPMNDSHLFHYHVFREKMKIVYPSDFTPHIQRLNFSWRRTFVLHSWCHPKEILTLAWDNLRQKFEISTIYVPIPQSYPH